MDAIEKEMLNLYAIADNGLGDLGPLQEYIETTYNEVIELAFPDPASKAYITDYYTQTAFDNRMFVLNEIFDLKKELFHIEVESTIKTFIGDEKNTLLTLSYGFSDFFRQIFPQEKMYLDKTFHQHKKNVILGFEPGISWRDTSNKEFTDLFNSNVSDLKTRLVSLLKRVFGTADVHSIKINDRAIMFTFTSRANEYMFIWVKAGFTIPVILKYYKAVMDMFRHRIMICSTNAGVCKEHFAKYSFFYDYFSNAITTSFGSKNKNVGTFKDEPSYWFQGKIEQPKTHMWEALGGKRSTRSRNKNSKRCTRKLRHTRKN